MAFQAAIPLIAAGITAFSSWLSNRQNKKIAESQNAAQMSMIDRMNEYNSPSAQRSRMVQAGYNPNLFYGQGSPGNQSTPGQPAPRQSIDLSRLADVVPLYNQTRLAESQVQAQNASTLKMTAEKDLKEVQTSVAKANPLLDQNYLRALVSTMQQGAQLKAAQAKMSGTMADWFTESNTEHRMPNGAVKLQTELDNLIQRNGLNTQDKAIKAEVLKSKQFQNDLLDIQRKWMQDGEITWQHFYQLLSSVLLKLM